MADVFLSYRNTEERRAIVSRLATILRAYGLSVWWDYGLAAGGGFKEQIERELQAAKVVVPVWCRESVKSDWVKREATLAETKLLPIRLQKVAPPAGFEHLHAHHLEAWTGSILDPQLEAFVKSVCNRIGHRPDISADTKSELAKLPPLKPLTPVGKGPGAFIAGLLVTAALLAGGAYWFPAASELLRNLWLEANIEEAAAAASETGLGLRSAQWHLGPASEGGAGILAYRERSGASGRGVTIALLGSGLYFQHREMVSHPGLLPGYDLIVSPERARDGDGPDADPSEEFIDCGPDAESGMTLFGTYLASIIIASGTGRSEILGVAPEASLVPVRVGSTCSLLLSEINRGIRWAAGLDIEEGIPLNRNPADIIFLPISFPGACPQSLQASINLARKEGAVIIVPAGDRGIAARDVAPANCRGVLSVGMVNIQGRPDPFTNSGAAVMAPGGNTWSDVNGDGRPDGIPGARYTNDCRYIDSRRAESCDYAIEFGTEAAAAIVAGAVALVMSENPGTEAQAAVDAVLAASVPMDARECSLPCARRPDLVPIPGLSDICYADCGVGRLDLSLVP